MLGIVDVSHRHKKKRTGKKHTVSASRHKKSVLGLSERSSATSKPRKGTADGPGFVIFEDDKENMVPGHHMALGASSYQSGRPRTALGELPNRLGPHADPGAENGAQRSSSAAVHDGEALLLKTGMVNHGAGAARKSTRREGASEKRAVLASRPQQRHALTVGRTKRSRHGVRAKGLRARKGLQEANPAASGGLQRVGSAAGQPSSSSASHLSAFAASIDTFSLGRVR